MLQSMNLLDGQPLQAVLSGTPYQRIVLALVELRYTVIGPQSRPLYIVAAMMDR